MATSKAPITPNCIPVKPKYFFGSVVGACAGGVYCGAGAALLGAVPGFALFFMAIMFPAKSVANPAAEPKICNIPLAWFPSKLSPVAVAKSVKNAMPWASHPVSAHSGVVGKWPIPYFWKTDLICWLWRLKITPKFCA